MKRSTPPVQSQWHTLPHCDAKLYLHCAVRTMTTTRTPTLDEVLNAYCKYAILPTLRTLKNRRNRNQLSVTLCWICSASVPTMIESTMDWPSCTSRGVVAKQPQIRDNVLPYDDASKTAETAQIKVAKEASDPRVQRTNSRTMYRSQAHNAKETDNVSRTYYSNAYHVVSNRLDVVVTYSKGGLVGWALFSWRDGLRERYHRRGSTTYVHNQIRYSAEGVWD
jgi:hypothetical protein